MRRERSHRRHSTKPGPPQPVEPRGSRVDDSDARRRLGAASLDYVLVLGVILPLVAIVMPLGRRILQLVYEMMLVLISWPFL